jgi:hypothetical protein
MKVKAKDIQNCNSTYKEHPKSYDENDKDKVGLLFSRITELELEDESSSNRFQNLTTIPARSATGSSIRGFMMSSASIATALSRSRAAQSQARIHHRLMELRILLQRYMVQLASSASSSTSNGTDCSLLHNDINQDIHTTFLDMRSIMVRNGIFDMELHAMEKEVEIAEEEEDKDYLKLREQQWKPVLNRHQRALKIRSGALVASSSFKHKTSGSSLQPQAFRVIDPTFWDHIQNIISQEKMMTTNHGSTNYSASSDDEAKTNNHIIYSDGKLYTNLLQDFISDDGYHSNINLNDGSHISSSSDAIKSLQLSMQKRVAHKKRVDRKASKGRKLRYKVYDKMTHYTFPIFRPTPTISEDQWFPSLFK